MNAKLTTTADFPARFLAYTVDSGMWSVVTTGSLWYLSQQVSLVDLVATAINVTLIGIFPAAMAYIMYSIVMTYRYGGTLGKLLLGLVVQDTHGALLTWKRAFFVQIIAKWVSGSALGIGYLAMLWHPERLTWHDILSGSVVKTDQPRYALGLAASVALVAVNGWLLYQAFLGFTTNELLIGEIQKIFSWL
jgi:uncharacterized RDD family membrane protein YckC